MELLVFLAVCALICALGMLEKVLRRVCAWYDSRPSYERLDNDNLNYWLKVLRSVRNGEVSSEDALRVCRSCGYSPEDTEMLENSIIEAERRYHRERVDLTQGREIRKRSWMAAQYEVVA